MSKLDIKIINENALKVEERAPILGTTPTGHFITPQFIINWAEANEEYAKYFCFKDSIQHFKSINRGKMVERLYDLRNMNNKILQYFRFLNIKSWRRNKGMLQFCEVMIDCMLNKCSGLHSLAYLNNHLQIHNSLELPYKFVGIKAELFNGQTQFFVAWYCKDEYTIDVNKTVDVILPNSPTAVRNSIISYALISMMGDHKSEIVTYQTWSSAKKFCADNVDKL